MSFPVLCSGLVSPWVGASHRGNLTAPFPLGQNCPRKMTMAMTMLWILILESVFQNRALGKKNQKIIVI